MSAGEGHLRASLPSRLNPMQIKLASVFVDDQDRALAFYTDVLGFAKMADVPVGTTGG